MTEETAGNEAGRLRVPSEGRSDGTERAGSQRHLEPRDAGRDALNGGRSEAAKPDGFAPETDGRGDWPPLEPPDRPGELGRFGRYGILEVVGRGDREVALRAFDPALHRAVTIRVFPPRLVASDADRERFLREGRSVASVRHENVAAVHDIGVADGFPYLVMQHVGGTSLRAKIARGGPLEMQDLLAVATQAASGLAAVHAQGLAHRGVDATNILLEDGDGRVKLAGFAPSGTIEGPPSPREVPALDPAALEPSSGEVSGHRADLAGLGCVILQMAGSPPSSREPAPGLPEWLAAIVRRLLDGDPDGGHATAAEVASLLSDRRERPRQGAQPPAVAPPEEVGASKAGPAGPRHRGRWRIPAAIATVGVICLTLGEALGIVDVRSMLTKLLTRAGTPGGVLVMEIKDPEIRVQVDGPSRVYSGGGVREVWLPAGVHTIRATRGSQVGPNEVIRVEKDGRLLVRVGLEPDGTPWTSAGLRSHRQRGGVRGGTEEMRARIEWLKNLVGSAGPAVAAAEAGLEQARAVSDARGRGLGDVRARETATDADRAEAREAREVAEAEVRVASASLDAARAHLREFERVLTAAVEIDGAARGRESAASRDADGRPQARPEAEPEPWQARCLSALREASEARRDAAAARMGAAEAHLGRISAERKAREADVERARAQAEAGTLRTGEVAAAEDRLARAFADERQAHMVLHMARLQLGHSEDLLRGANEAAQARPTEASLRHMLEAACRDLAPDLGPPPGTAWGAGMAGGPWGMTPPSTPRGTPDFGPGYGPGVSDNMQRDPDRDGPGATIATPGPSRAESGRVAGVVGLKSEGLVTPRWAAESAARLAPGFAGLTPVNSPDAGPNRAGPTQPDPGASPGEDPRLYPFLQSDRELTRLRGELTGAREELKKAEASARAPDSDPTVRQLRAEYADLEGLYRRRRGEIGDWFRGLPPPSQGQGAQAAEGRIVRAFEAHPAVVALMRRTAEVEASLARAREAVSNPDEDPFVAHLERQVEDLRHGRARLWQRMSPILQSYYSGEGTIAGHGPTVDPSGPSAPSFRWPAPSTLPELPHARR